ncbi:nuclear transport factor 2 family protein [Phenylobacterium soli]|uniref:Nuclear transport factor 2 family protein n=1 Tax=Phenylobacterium soli TaxID=2170551 RepID=A0A328ARD6_9CAUL|nr:nuclear transport factor 2 family protein [Phenylobacterium soli]RAK55508.1 nuclear transport factor 2 family protein [Phenylobacterium soli]
MPSRETVAAFVADVLSEDHVGAIERWYADDASMQENQEPPRVGKETLMAGERQMLARVESVTTEVIGQPLVEGDEVAIRWRFEFTLKDGSTMVMEEVAWQIWRGDQILRETFFYDPAQRSRRG